MSEQQPEPQNDELDETRPESDEPQGDDAPAPDADTSGDELDENDENDENTDTAAR